MMVRFLLAAGCALAVFLGTAGPAAADCTTLVDCTVEEATTRVDEAQQEAERIVYEEVLPLSEEVERIVYDVVLPLVEEKKEEVLRTLDDLKSRDSWACSLSGQLTEGTSSTYRFEGPATCVLVDHMGVESGPRTGQFVLAGTYIETSDPITGETHNNLCNYEFSGTLEIPGVLPDSAPVRYEASLTRGHGLVTPGPTAPDGALGTINLVHASILDGSPGCLSTETQAGRPGLFVESRLIAPAHSPTP